MVQLKDQRWTIGFTSFLYDHLAFGLGILAQRRASLPLGAGRACELSQMSLIAMSALGYARFSLFLFTLLGPYRCYWGMGNIPIGLMRAFWEKWGVWVIYPSCPSKECFSNHMQRDYKHVALAYFHPLLLSVTPLFYLFSCAPTLPSPPQFCTATALPAPTFFSASSTGTHPIFCCFASSLPHPLSSTPSLLDHYAWSPSPSLDPAT